MFEYQSFPLDGVFYHDSDVRFEWQHLVLLEREIEFF